MLIVGQTELFRFFWKRNGSFLTTGSATVQVRRRNGGATEYLQSDLTSWSATPANLSTTQSGNGFELALLIPSSAKGFNIVAIGTHSDAALPPLSEEHFVVSQTPDTTHDKVTDIHRDLELDPAYDVVYQTGAEHVYPTGTTADPVIEKSMTGTDPVTVHRTT
jgi:hypothetical protein